MEMSARSRRVAHFLQKATSRAFAALAPPNAWPNQPTIAPFSTTIAKQLLKYQNPWRQDGAEAHAEHGTKRPGGLAGWKDAQPIRAGSADASAPLLRLASSNRQSPDMRY